MKFCEFKKMYFLQNDLAAAVIVFFYVNFQQQRFLMFSTFFYDFMQKNFAQNFHTFIFENGRRNHIY